MRPFEKTTEYMDYDDYTIDPDDDKSWVLSIILIVVFLCLKLTWKMIWKLF